ncbi:putative ATP-dependent DNA helicase Q1 [Saccoglossus kowalevskii]
MKSIYHVLHYGSSFYLESYIQESGRVGRDGKPSHAALFYHGGMLRDICPELKSYVKNDTLCRRVKLFEDFTSSKDLSVLKNKESHHNCCDICERNYSCTGSNYDSHANCVEKYMVHYCANTESDESRAV